MTYKLITKVLVNRLRPFLNDLIGPMQSSFLPGRGTMDNSLVDQEVVHQMSVSTSKKGSMTFKIDLEKAYNSVALPFLRETLELFGFPRVTVDLIVCCVSSSTISLLWNGVHLDKGIPCPLTSLSCAWKGFRSIFNTWWTLGGGNL